MSQEELKVSPEILKLAGELKKEFKIGDGGLIEVPKSFYEDHLPEGLTMAIVKKVQDHDSNMTSATVLGMGEVSIPAFKKDKKLESTSIEYSAGKNSIGAVMHRSKTMTNPQGGEPITKFGVVTAKYQARASANLGALKRIRTHLNAQAASVFGS